MSTTRTTRLTHAAIVSCLVTAGYGSPSSAPFAPAAPAPQTTRAAQSGAASIDLEDFLVMPMTGRVDGKGSNELLLSRVNTLREEAGGAKRFFVSDLNGPLYIVDKETKKLSLYLDFNGNEGKKGLFRRLTIQQGYGNGLNGFYLDPDYTRNGKFYTVHIEDPSLAGSNLPDNASVPGLNVQGYTTTAVVKTPGPYQNEGVLIEWTDTNPSNSTFEGTARELLRVQLNTRSHPMGDMIFDPTARPGDPEWRVLYIECGDGASGESQITAIRSNPQRLDTLEGKILRIVPDLNEHVATSTVSENGRYRIPNDNPFVSTRGARREIWAYGFRNPHRLNWAIDPSNAANNHLIVNSVGLHTWETVYIVHKGANYGYGRREGNELLKPDNTTAPLPADDRIPVQVGETPSEQLIAPTYPVIQYGHDPTGGDSIGSGFVYNGNAIPSLRGKYIFTDLTTGRIWWADYKDMRAADDGNPATLARIHEVKVRWNDPSDSPDAGMKTYDSMFPIVEAAYHARGGKMPHLATRSDLVFGGRADVRLSVDAAGELYLYSKSDGVLRRIVGGKGFDAATPAPDVPAPRAQAAAPSTRPVPPTRDPKTPGYVAARDLPDGAVPPPDVDGNFIIGPTHNPAAEAVAHDGVLQGSICNITMSSADSKIYPGIAREAGTFGAVDPADPAKLVVTTSHPAPYTRRVAVYVPKQYVPATAAAFIVGADGPDQLLFTTLDNLIAQKRVPVMIGISIGNGSGDAQGSQRGLEYDTMSGRYAEFVEAEVLPFVERQCNVRLTRDPDGRATMGGSSGGSAALIMAWYHPELYHRVLTYSGTYVNQQWPPNADTPHGAWEFHEHLIRNSAPKPIRIWMEVGDRDLLNPNVMRDNMHDWVEANERMARVLADKGYHYQFVFARNAGHTDRTVKQQTLPEALEWLWKGYR